MIKKRVITPIVGLEIHVQLKTKSKMFCGCSAMYFADAPNTHMCPTCLGLPGALPRPNRAALEKAIKVGVALNCKINNISRFDRKNYMYPDLFKGYQITQFEIPICGQGYIYIEKESGERKKININRAHQEEDTAKSIHEKDCTLIDGNKAGIPLLEIVSEPDMGSAEEAVLYAKYIYDTVRFIGASDADMEKGQMRFDVNVNIKIKTVNDDDSFDEVATPIAEIKNLNSFRSMSDAIAYEIERQEKEYEETHSVFAKGTKTTRGWSDERGETYLLRSKEESEDYRYFPEPDLLPIVFSEIQVEKLRKEVGEIPSTIKECYIKDLGLPNDVAETLSKDRSLYEYFEEAKKEYKNTKKLANWIMNEIVGNEYIKLEFQKESINSVFPIKSLLEILSLVDENKITANIGKSLVERSITYYFNEKEHLDIKDLVKKEGLLQVSDESDLLVHIEKIFSLPDGIDAVEKYKAGKTSVIMFLVGLVMRELKGKGNAAAIKELIEDKIKKS